MTVFGMFVEWFRRFTHRPIYIHDCNRCRFLGHYQEVATYSGESTWMDLYACPSVAGRTVIARYGSKGDHYVSGICFGVQAILDGKQHPLRRAIELAKELDVDLGSQADFSKVNYCALHMRRIAPGTECPQCFLDQMKEKLREPA